MRFCWQTKSQDEPRFASMKILTVRTVPVVKWSSTHPLNFAPRTPTLFYLVLGLALFGLGEALLIAAAIGVSPWIVLAQGLVNQSDISIGWATFSVSGVVLLLWLPLKQQPGPGTLLNALIIPVMIELCMPLLPKPDALVLQLMEAVMGVLCVGIGSGLYLTARLGPGPRDGLMTGLQQLTGYPVSLVRLFLEVSVVSIGWLLGGTAGIGTLLFAFGIGPSVSASLYAVSVIFSKPTQDQ